MNDVMKLLRCCLRHELRDHAFGDVEVTWSKDGQDVASGYFNRTGGMVSCGDQTFTGIAAEPMRNLGTLSTVERNDSTGPAIFQEGVIMPALTTEYVRYELED